MSTSQNTAADTALIVAAGGASRRFGQDKMFVELRGIPLFVHCIRTLAPALGNDNIVLSVPESHEAKFRAVAEQFLPGVRIRYAHGGLTRMESVRNALAIVRSLPDIRYVAVHDAARPFITLSLFQQCLAACRANGGALLCRRITDTVKRTDDSGLSLETLSRDFLRAAETPQMFELGPFVEAYDRAVQSAELFTDDAQVMERFGTFHPYLVEHRSDNRKITFAEDLQF